MLVMSKFPTKEEIDAEGKAAVESLLRGAGRPVSTGRSRAAGGKRINVACSADEYDEITRAAKARHQTPGAFVLEVALRLARAYNHRRPR